MAKKDRTPSSDAPRIVTPDRARRLHLLVRLLGKGSQKRAALAKRLRLDTRGFYRDLEFLRSTGIKVTLREQRYSLNESVTAAVGKLPLPDPGLTLAEATQLAKGRTPAHRKIKEMLQQIIR